MVTLREAVWRHVGRRVGRGGVVAGRLSCGGVWGGALSGDGSAS